MTDVGVEHWLESGPAPVGDASVLEGDGVPDSNQSLTCFSCDAPMTDLYCGNCGQKNDDFRRPLWRLGAEAFAAFTAFESRIWRTWANLLARPGRVAREYADGRRNHWSSPVRVYIFMSILLFGYMEVTGTQFVALDVDVSPVAEPEPGGSAFEIEIEPLFFEREGVIRELNRGKDFALIERVLAEGDFEVDIGWGGVEADSLDGMDPESREALANDMDRLREEMRRLEADTGVAGIAGEIPDFRTGERDGSGMTINGEDVSSAQGAHLVAEIARNPGIVNGVLATWLPRVVFLMMPLSMLIGAVFIRGRRRRGWKRRRDPEAKPALLYDHAVHAAYLHAVAYLFAFLSIVAAQAMGSGAVAVTLFVVLLVYLPLSLRRMFGRSWIKTVWASYAVGFIYFTVITSVMSGIVADAIDDRLEREAELRPPAGAEVEGQG